jgi:hypothetical protein
VESEERVPPEGTFASVQGAVSVEDASVSEKVARTRSTLPLAVVSCMSRLTRIGVAWSAGALEPNEDWLPAASWMPVALAASVTRKEPTAVF